MNQYTIIVFGVLGVIGVIPPWMVLGAPTGDIEIWDGESIEINQAPHQIALLKNGRFYCGGALIAPDIVLTAGHCINLREIVDVTPDSKLSIRAGSNSKNTGGIVVKVTGGEMHPKYVSDAGKDYDIAILRLEKSLASSGNMSAIKLAPKDYKIKDGEMMSVTGWGRMRNLTSPEILQMVELPKFNIAECRKIYDAAGYAPITERFLCAGTPEGGKNACHGDSGGPLVHKGLLVGVVSGGNSECAVPNFPANYQKVSVVRDWIDAFMKPKP